MKRLTTICMAMLLAGCTAEHAADFKAAQAAVKESLRDPTSAQFQNMHAIRSETDALIVCGEYNAKNGMGGYVGFQPFMWSAIDGGMLITMNLSTVEAEKERLRNFIQATCTGKPGSEVVDTLIK